MVYVLFTWSITCFNWSISIYNAVLILQYRKWLSYTHTFLICSLPLFLSRDTEYTSLCCTVGSCFSILSVYNSLPNPYPIYLDNWNSILYVRESVSISYIAIPVSLSLFGHNIQLVDCIFLETSISFRLLNLFKFNCL